MHLIKRTFLLAISLYSIHLSAQSDKEILKNLLDKERNEYAQGLFKETVQTFETIQSISNEYPVEATRLAIGACESLIGSLKDPNSKTHFQAKKRVFKNILLLQEKILTLESNSNNGYMPVNELRENYNRNTVYPKGSRMLKNGEKIKYEEFKRLLCSYEDSEKEFNQFQKKSITGGLLFTGTLLSYTAALLVSKRNPDLAGGLGIAGFALNIAALPFMVKARNHLNKATWHYNREASINHSK